MSSDVSGERSRSFNKDEDVDMNDNRSNTTIEYTGGGYQSNAISSSFVTKETVATATNITTPTFANEIDATEAKPYGSGTDLLSSIGGLFRILDLYSEDGSGGLVDKIIIDQQHVAKFIDTILPGAYKSMTDIDFAALDNITLKPIGIYGSKTEIVELMKDLRVITSNTASLLLLPIDPSSQTQQTLRSGIYILLPPDHTSHAASNVTISFYVVYWPEDKTWDDKESTGSKNRVAFMHYLTHLTDQLRCLLSREHVSSLVLKQPSNDETKGATTSDRKSGISSHHEAGRRFHKFEVAKASEEEEGVQLRDNFTLRYASLAPSRPLTSSSFETLPTILVRGELFQAFLIQKRYPERYEKRQQTATYNEIRLTALLKDTPNIILHPSLPATAVICLMAQGSLRHRPNVLDKYRAFVAKYRRIEEEGQRSLKNSSVGMTATQQDRAKLQWQIRTYLVHIVSKIYPTLRIDSCWNFSDYIRNLGADRTARHEEDYLMFMSNEDIRNVVAGVMKDVDLKRINSPGYIDHKDRLTLIRHLIAQQGGLTDEQRLQLGTGILSEKVQVARPPPPAGSPWGGFLKALANTFGFSYGSLTGGNVASFWASVKRLKDPEFVASLTNIANEDPMYASSATRLSGMALASIHEMMKELENSLVTKIGIMQKRAAEERSKEATRERVESERLAALQEFNSSIRHDLCPDPSKPALFIEDFQDVSSKNAGYNQYAVRAYSAYRVESELKADLWPLQLTEHDQQKLRDLPTHIPQPRLPNGPTYSFTLPPDCNVRHVQLLGTRSITCLITYDRNGIRLWLISSLKRFSYLQPTKTLRAIAAEFVVAADEQRKCLVIVFFDKYRISAHMYSFDGDFTSITGRGSPMELARWYPEGVPSFTSACFFSGTEDLCMVESTGRIRVFSFIAQTFRPATISVPAFPAHVQSSPDGSALVIVESSKTSCRVFHQASWGHNKTGIITVLPESFSHATAFTISSLAQRDRSILIGLYPTLQSMQAVSLDISRKETVYQFRAKRNQQRSQGTVVTEHNSLIDCFSEVWSRYPVVAAIQREVLSLAQRQPFGITFVSESPGLPFASYFKSMVRTFAKVAKKPTGGKLGHIVVDSSDVRLPTPNLHGSSSSLFRAGEWLTELICLIPIHIAVARENRFIPLKDGVFNSSLERDLLAAEISAIIDSISLGWYESILSSYMATKPVKVISSMGEQSVGKSYSLNHIVDSSFAGSAVRTTEGVWLSICPTKNLLVVALDFEGVHSIERTAQEDMLLVLFNTALSNLILFRNNFALSRDVANMFTSFQSSTHHFDPASNPNLFKGLLAIVIKDVVDNDQEGIVQEFTSKFHQIVLKEQAENFITLLHDSQLDVIPWSVIQSPEFYDLFDELSHTLFEQRSTHASAGEFLITLKTLMAKLKAQDWGSIDQTVIKHRVALLQSRLPSALATGLSETQPVVEHLKNLDTQEIVNDHGDGPVVFCLEKSPQSVSAVLSQHLRQWKDEAARYSVEDLVAHLDGMLAARIAHVTDWLLQNIARFPPDNADIRAIKRSFDESLTTLRSSVQLCLAECSSCRLRCMLNKAHDQMEKHDCGTSHRCDQPCEYEDNHGDGEHCGFAAGHHGRHICDPSIHLCGERCHLSDKHGCQKHCTKPSDHLITDGLHECSARTHQCGKPCDLKKVRTPSGGDYSCQAFCSLPYDDSHIRHSCDNRVTCPIKCTLCTQGCTLGDHFHGLDNTAAVHLCGEQHPCKQLCQEAGTCEVNTKPQSIKTTYIGLHETFQYPKYTQVAKRLPCAVTIPAGETEHVGRHVHSLDEDPFHYCEAQCENCNYICTLPLGHPQAEHETSHGSMENTAWTIEGEDDVTIEVEGRTYGIRDGGAPQLCSSVCRNLGRHAHIVFCDAEEGSQCQVQESEHITRRMLPNPDLSKDWVSHKVFWARTGFRDPYSREEKEEFALCDRHCPGPEHEASATADANPSFCTLQIFHPPQPVNWQAGGNDSYVSSDGHIFPCPNPDSLRQAFHVIFVLDRSGSMTKSDRIPLPDQPVTQMIAARSNNRFGAVLSACYAFWVSRAANVAAGNRRDAYSIVTFDHTAQVVLANDFTSEPDQLLNPLLTGANRYGGTNFDNALREAQGVLEDNWSNNRTPVIVFLSDGECGVSDNVVFDICDRAVALGTPLSIQTVSFGDDFNSTALRRMVTIAEQVAQGAPPDPRRPVVPSGYTVAIDTIRLTETFLNIAASLQKPRAALIRF